VSCVKEGKINPADDKCRTASIRLLFVLATNVSVAGVVHYVI
jgi:hypothetical protein